MKATISLSNTVRATLDEDGNLTLTGVLNELRLDAAATARLSYLLGGAAADELRGLLATLTAMRDSSPDPVLRRLAREVLRDRPNEGMTDASAA